MEKSFKNILVIGATSRNLGKTTLVCQMIRRFSNNRITALKIKTLRDGDQEFHGRGSFLEVPFLVRDESETGGLNDSALYKAAGAAQVIYIKSKIEFLEEAFQKALEMIPENHLLIIESNSIVELINPGIYILIKGLDPDTYKPSSLTTEKSADIILSSDGRNFSEDPAHLPVGITPLGWSKIVIPPAISGS